MGIRGFSSDDFRAIVECDDQFQLRYDLSVELGINLPTTGHSIQIRQPCGMIPSLKAFLEVSKTMNGNVKRCCLVAGGAA
jgi:hypothetical protein